jgi:hypothetical protein
VSLAVSTAAAYPIHRQGRLTGRGITCWTPTPKQHTALTCLSLKSTGNCSPDSLPIISLPSKSSHHEDTGQNIRGFRRVSSEPLRADSE